MWEKPAGNAGDPCMAMAWLGPATAGQAAMADRTSAQTGNVPRRADGRRAVRAFDSEWLTSEFYHRRSRKTECRSLMTAGGIDLFTRRCIEGGQLTMAVRPVTQPPHLAQRQPLKRGRLRRRCRGFKGAGVQKGFP